MINYRVNQKDLYRKSTYMTELPTVPKEGFKEWFNSLSRDEQMVLYKARCELEDQYANEGRLDKKLPCSTAHKLVEHFREQFQVEGFL